MWDPRAPDGYGPPGMSVHGGAALYPSPSYGPPMVHGYGYPYPHHPYSKGEQCDEECAEEECNRDMCGDEHRPPREGEQICGIDIRPALPLALGSSTVIGAVCMLGVQLLLLATKNIPAAIVLYVIFGLVYAVTLICMAYATWADPGQLRREQAQAFSDMASVRNIQANGNGELLPQRCQKTWLYKRPLRRYDHYCRWLCNCIALMNHREFILMCMGLVLISLLSMVTDVVIIVLFFQQWWALALIALHFIYSVVLFTLVGPIAKVHLGLISRNELAAEWKRNDFYVVRKGGKPVPVSELADEEYNELFEQFVYDRRRNPFDAGISRNCWSFWCVSRWSAEQLGDF
mmetsp:Transcript_31337/g.71554  ORF Transcript_31337/g.71554 Transcript_31337/m.71554 type:complete len:346 (+) Transcript_31337:164-1201(+)